MNGDKKSITCGLPGDGNRDPKQPSQTSAASQRKLETNRANSLKSTGPKTARGKNVARFNALKHGGYVRDLFILQGKHLPEFERFNQLSEQLQEQVASGAYLEDKVLIQMFVMVVWRLELLTGLELRTAQQGGAAALAEAFPNALPASASAFRNFEHILDLVQQLRQRLEEADAAEAEAEAAESASAGDHTAVHVETTAEPDGVRATDVSDSNTSPDTGKGTSANGGGVHGLDKVSPSAAVPENGNRNPAG